jgi:putative sigma-54 modulation protein
MELQITSKNLDLTDEMRTLIENKVGKISQYVSKASEAKVELSYEKTKSPDKRYRSQVTVTVKGILLRAEEKAENIRASIDRVSDKIIEQAKRYKDIRSTKGRGVSKVRQTANVLTLSAKRDEESYSDSDVVRVKRFPVKPMEINEAIEQMELLGHNFFLFVNSETNRFSCLYHRKDEKYGLIETDITHSN